MNKQLISALNELNALRKGASTSTIKTADNAFIIYNEKNNSDLFFNAIKHLARIPSTREAEDQKILFSRLDELQTSLNAKTMPSLGR